MAITLVIHLLTHQFLCRYLSNDTIGVIYINYSNNDVM